MKPAVLQLLALVTAIAVVSAAIAFASGSRLGLPSAHVWELWIYLLATGVATMLAGLGVLRLFSRRMRLATRVVGAASLGVVVGLVNVGLISARMFLSTDHDLVLLFGLLLFAGFLSALLATVVAREIAGEVSGLRAAAQDLGEGDLNARVPVRRDDELGEVAVAFNRMAERLQVASKQQAELERARREMTASVSHDLRTPLSSLQAMIEAVQDGVVEGDEVPRYLGQMGREVERLSRLVDDLFELALLDAGALPMSRELTPLQALVLDSIDSLRAQAARRRVSLKFEPGGCDLALWVDPQHVQRALVNLVQNAIEHTPGDGTVIVRVADDGDSARVEVADQGEGIEEAALPRVWDRFYRADQSRTRSTDSGPHAGLGLAIAQGLVEAHGGRVSVESRRGIGSTFAFTLPKSAPASG